jgi:hypothetical protein
MGKNSDLSFAFSNTFIRVNRVALVPDKKHWNNWEKMPVELFEYVSFGADNICYKSRLTENCQHYYTLSDGMKKCATMAECNKLNYLFLDGEE